jgi:hypothetical protein
MLLGRSRLDGTSWQHYPRRGRWISGSILPFTARSGPLESPWRDIEHGCSTIPRFLRLTIISSIAFERSRSTWKCHKPISDRERATNTEATHAEALSWHYHVQKVRAVMLLVLYYN